MVSNVIVLFEIWMNRTLQLAKKFARKENFVECPIYIDYINLSINQFLKNSPLYVVFLE